MTNTELLKQKIDDSGMPFSTVAIRSGITRETLYNKVNGESEFKASEMENLSKVLHLKQKEFNAIFFAKECESNSHSEEN